MLLEELLNKHGLTRNDLPEDIEVIYLGTEAILSVPQISTSGKKYYYVIALFDGVEYSFKLRLRLVRMIKQSNTTLAVLLHPNSDKVKQFFIKLGAVVKDDAVIFVR